MRLRIFWGRAERSCQNMGPVVFAMLRHFCVIDQGHCYRVRDIRENGGVPRSRAEENVEHVELLQVAPNLGVRYINEEEDLKVEKRITVVGRKLELRTHLDGRMCSFRPSSWRWSIHAVATAIHFDETHEDARRREEFIKGHSKELPEAYRQPVGKWRYWDTERKTILKCHKNEELGFFSVLHYECEHCLPIIIRHSGSLFVRCPCCGGDIENMGSDRLVAVEPSPFEYFPNNCSYVSYTQFIYTGRETQLPCKSSVVLGVRSTEGVNICVNGSIQPTQQIERFLFAINVS